MYKYLLIESKSQMNTLKASILEIFNEMIEIEEIIEDEKSLILTYQNQIETELSEVIVNFASDMLLDIRLYESYKFHTKREMIKHYQFIKKLMSELSFKILYLNDLLLTKLMLTKLKIEDYQYFLRSYTNNQMMINTVMVYLESDQNMSEASKKLYIHRNTLIQRIDKFVNETGFDIKKFIDGYIIYYMITH